MQAGDALCLFRFEVGFYGLLVCIAMSFEHDAGSGFEFAGLVFEVGASPALLLAGVAGKFDTVDGEHLASYQILAITQVEDLGKDAGDGVSKGRDKAGYRGEVRLGVAGQGDEHDVITADGFDAAAGNNTLAVGEQDNLEQHGRRIGGSASFIIMKRVSKLDRSSSWSMR